MSLIINIGFWSLILFLFTFLLGQNKKTSHPLVVIVAGLTAVISHVVILIMIFTLNPYVILGIVSYYGYGEITKKSITPPSTTAVTFLGKTVNNPLPSDKKSVVLTLLGIFISFFPFIAYYLSA